ncbi:MAG: hypothetical protein PF638_05310 [Candidatus Delongbacteria bacterium]|jgi:hypothetical protein|nr:hypothetical protein [Candidatus Delongbacteria bacterium]
MRYLLIIIFLLSTIFSSFAKTVILSGFKPVKESRYEFISTSFKKYVIENIKNSEIEILDEKKSNELEYLLVKNRNFFLASKEFFDNWENFEFDYTIHCSFDIRGKSIQIQIQVYSKEKKRLLLKEDFKGRSNRLLSLFDAITRNILISIDSNKQTINPFNINDNKMFYQFLRLDYYADKLWESDDPDKYFLLFDELESYKGEFDIYPPIKKLYEDVASRNDEFILTGALDLPVENASKEVFSEDNEVEAFLRKLLNDGYHFRHLSTTKNYDEDDKSIVSLIVAYEINFKKLLKKKLLQEIKKRRGNLKFANMGMYYFSSNDSENNDLIDFLLRQRVILRLYDKNDNLITESEISINYMDYQSGKYKNAKKVLLPLVPRGSANTAFAVESKGFSTFIFDEIPTSELDKIVRSELELTFE